MPSNYRPISLVPVIAKITERIVQRQLHYYLASNYLLSDSQHGFRPNHSTTSALIDISDSILAAMDDTEISLLCLIDLSKCFDVISHSKLLDKLQLLGVDAGWFRSYLEGHTQSVCTTNSRGRRVLSKPLPNNVGVFQGSALGPLLFTVFANDLSLHAPDARIIQYADDTQVLVSGRKSELDSTVARLEVTLDALSDWFAANGLKVNAEKTQLMTFGSRQNLRGLPDISVRFRGAVLKPCQQVKNLGVVFDPCLTWDDHVATLTRKCYGTLIGLSHVRHHLPADTIVTIVNALVLSHIRYCLPVYGNCTKKNLGRIEKVLNFAARVVSGRRKYDHVADVRGALGWLSAADLSAYDTLVLLHRVICSKEPAALAGRFQRNEEMRERLTRQDGQLSLPRIRTESGKRRFCYRAAKQHNELPIDLQHMTNRQFKSALKRHFAGR